jgi:hypothetical protein
VFLKPTEIPSLSCQCRIQGGLKNSSLRRPHFGQRCSGSTGVPHFRQCGFIGTMLLRALMSKT